MIYKIVMLSIMNIYISQNQVNVFLILYLIIFMMLVIGIHNKYKIIAQIKIYLGKILDCVISIKYQN